MRVPILLWGDLVEKNKAITRRSLVGESAHECMYAWVYLTDFLAVRRILSHIETLRMQNTSEKGVLFDFDTEVWSSIDRKVIDPHYQLNKSGLETACILNAIFYSFNDSDSGILNTVVELGQTFFTAIDKFHFVQRLSEDHFDIHYDADNIKWVGIDNSEFCNTTAQIIHGQYQQNIQFHTDWRGFSETENSIFHSRFVCSYAFEDTVSLAEFVSRNFKCAIIEDAFSVLNTEKHVYNHGQKEVFFNINFLSQYLLENDFEVYILDYYGDWPAESDRCLVVKLLIVKTGVISKEKLACFLKYHGFEINLKDRADENILDLMLSSITQMDWKKIYKNKKINPVWGKTNTSNWSNNKNILRYLSDKFLLFKRGYIAYSLKGQNAEQEIVRHIKEQQFKPK